MSKPEIAEPFEAAFDYGYSPAQWQTVTRKLDAIGINVAISIAYAMPWGEPHSVTRPLGDVLQELAGVFGAMARLGEQRPPPKRHAEQVQKLLALLRAAVAGLEDHYSPLRGRALVVSEFARGLIPELEQQLAELVAAGKDGRSDNTVAMHTRHWRALMQLWWAIPAINRQHKHCIEFLLICAKPVFATATTPTAVANFVAHNFLATKL